MDKWDYLRELQRSFAFDLSIGDNGAALTNRGTGGRIEIFEDSFGDGESLYTEYIVSFSTQHRHFEDPDDVEDYVRRILDDEVLPIEFYYHGERRFGSEIGKDDYRRLSSEFLAGFFGYPAEYLSQFEYEIHSWSGKYDTDRRSPEE